jgi:two-component system sensor histidine kinase YesM
MIISHSRSEDKEHKHSLRVILYAIFVMAWMVPICSFSYFIFFNYQNAYIEKSRNLINNAVKVSGVLIKTDLDEAVTKIRKPTYEGDWEQLYDRYDKNKITHSEYLTSMKASLISKYYMDAQISRFAFYMEDSDDPACYSGKNGYRYESYLEKAQPFVDKIRKGKSNYTEAFISDDQIYLVRNLYTVNTYREYGTLVIGIDRDELFEKLPLEHPDMVSVYLNGDREDILTKNESADITNEKKGEYETYSYEYADDDYDLKLEYKVPESELYSGISRLNLIAIITILGMAPLIFLTYRLVRKNIDRPLQKLVEASEAIKQGKLGTNVDQSDIPNKEFGELVDSFNSMSDQLQYLFNTVYREKMANKDAQIAALQAQINPHFLNNTLEMMNWQARMNNDPQVSKMIEALGTVLDSSMGRDNDRLVRLADELRAADAYLYIMSMRFGKRLNVEKEIDDNLLQAQVPRLILQPLIENAIKYGIEQVSSGTLWLRISREEDIVVEVINTGKKMSDEEIEHIRDVISGKYKADKSKPGAHTSIGIYNVNKRISLIFGADYGLSVSQTDDGRTVFKIVMPYTV